MSAIDVNPGQFPSFEKLSACHDEMLGAAEASDKSLAAITDEEIVGFLDRAAATGAVITDPRERRTARSILNFWAAELITRGKAGSAWSARELAPAEREKSASPDAVPSPSYDADLERSRALVRIAASARQWVAGGRAPGWLLKGKALAEAEHFVKDDDDIRALVQASHVYGGIQTRNTVAVLGTLVFLLAGALIWAVVAGNRAAIARDEAKTALEDTRIARDQATKARDEATKSRDEATKARDEATAARDKANAALEEVTAARDQAAVEAKAAGDALQAAATDAVQRNLAQQRELDKALLALKDVAPLVRRARDAGQIDANSIPEPLRPLIDALDSKAPATLAILPADRSLVRGYDPHFLRPPSVQQKQQAPGDPDGGIAIPLPRLTGPALAGAHNEGKPVDYVNFSMVLSRIRHMPALAAVNLRRTAVGSLLRVDAPFQYDQRVPREAQPVSTAFESNDIDRGHLVNAREIAWGPAFGTNPAETGRLAYTMINVMTNVTPQFDTFNQGLWFEAERYAREEFSGRSDRVTIFSGPVLRTADPKIGSSDLRIPRHFWKVLVAANPDNPADLVVEAYLVPQFGDGDTKIAKVKFVPQVYRVRVTDIEVVTGLDFGTVVRAVDTRSWTTTQTTAPPPRDASRAAQLAALAGEDNAARAAAARDLVALLDGPTIAESDLRSLVERVVALASAESFRGLSAGARASVLTVLAAVPQARWEQERWVDLRAAARRAVADAGETLGGCAQPAGACERIAALKPKLGWALASGRTVYVRFAGMVREDVKAISDKLKLLGWRVQGEERSANAAKTNEVRHDDDGEDPRAGELLAADLRALGRSAVRAKNLPAVRPKLLEIWISI